MLRSVLLVDDDEVNNFINERLLKRVQISEEIIVRKNGKEALTYIEAAAKTDKIPEVVFLDLNMPVMDGFEFYAYYKKLLSSLGKRSEVVMLSGSEKPDDLEKALKEGIKHYIMKPLKKESLLQLLERINKDKYLAA